MKKIYTIKTVDKNDNIFSGMTFYEDKNFAERVAEGLKEYEFYKEVEVLEFDLYTL